MWLLLVEDDRRLGKSLSKGLEEEGFVVDWVTDGDEAEAKGMANSYDVAVFDWRLPRQDGPTVVKQLREGGRGYPILMLTVLDDIDHRIAGLDAGADDYLTKPFSFEELLARLRALLRRPPFSSVEGRLRLGPLDLDFRRRKAHLRGIALELRPKEYDLLELMARRPNEVISRTVLSERIWGDAFSISDNVIDVTVSGLRHALDKANSEQVELRVETIRGVGYLLATKAD